MTDHRIPLSFDADGKVVGLGRVEAAPVQPSSAESRDALITRLQARVEAHDKMCFGSPMGLGYYSGNDARLMRDAIDALRTIPDAAQQPSKHEEFCHWLKGYLGAVKGRDELTPHEANTIRGNLNELIAAQPPAAPDLREQRRAERRERTGLDVEEALTLDDVQRSSAVTREPYPEPTPAMLDNDPLFDAIWDAIKRWDISRHNDGMYSGLTGNDVRHIYDAIKRIPTEPQTSIEPDEILRLRAAMDYACDLLAERTYGSPARSPGHNARLHLETALAHSRPHLARGE
jgi:hypothetical protein